MLGDIFCQTAVEKKAWEDYSVIRTFRQWSVAFFCLAPTAHFWFTKVSPALTGSITKRPLKIMASVILDNTVYGAAMLASGVLTLELLKSWSLETSLKNMESKFLTMYSTAIGFWGSVSMLNNMVMPVLYRGLFTNACGVVWQIYISYMVNTKKVVISEEEVLEALPMKD